jgi:hypothetical protein
MRARCPYFQYARWRQHTLDRPLSPVFRLVMPMPLQDALAPIAQIQRAQRIHVLRCPVCSQTSCACASLRLRNPPKKLAKSRSREIATHAITSCHPTHLLFRFRVRFNGPHCAFVVLDMLNGLKLQASVYGVCSRGELVENIPQIALFHSQDHAQ